MSILENAIGFLLLCYLQLYYFGSVLPLDTDPLLHKQPCFIDQGFSHPFPFLRALWPDFLVLVRWPCIFIVSVHFCGFNFLRSYGFGSQTCCVRLFKQPHKIFCRLSQNLSIVKRRCCSSSSFAKSSISCFLPLDIIAESIDVCEEPLALEYTYGAT